MKKYKNKYRIPSARKPDWDYRNAGAYFITICTHNRVHHFGTVRDKKMVLTSVGALVQGFWYEIPKHFDHVQLGEFVVMPNHLHGILILMDSGNDGNSDDVQTRQPNHTQTRHAQHSDHVQTRHCHVSTDGDGNNDFYKKIIPKRGSIPTIIGSFKSICTRHINQSFANLNFKWQERYHDHVIRNEPSFERISNYIINNPKQWDTDKFHKNE